MLSLLPTVYSRTLFSGQRHARSLRFLFITNHQPKCIKRSDCLAAKLKKERPKAFSELKAKQIESILETSLLTIQSNKFEAAQLLDGRVTPLCDDVKLEIFKLIKIDIGSSGYPTVYSSEAHVQLLVSTILSPILTTVKTKIKNNQIKLVHGKHLSFELPTGSCNGKQEFVIGHRSSNTLGCDVIVVVVKRRDFDEGLNQALLALRAMWIDLMSSCKIVPQNELLFGFITDSRNWRLVTFNGREYRVSHSMVGLIDCLSDLELLFDKKDPNFIETRELEIQKLFLEPSTQLLDIIHSVMLIGTAQAKRWIDPAGL